MVLVMFPRIGPVLHLTVIQLSQCQHPQKKERKCVVYSECMTEFRNNEISFKKCQFSKLIRCEHCQSHPSIVKLSLNFIQTSGKTLLEPTPSANYPEHFKTFLNMAENVEKGNTDQFTKPGVGPGIESG